MPDFEYLTPNAGSRLMKLGDVAKIADAIRSGGLAILPTETGYMLAAQATSKKAVLDAFAVKRRDLSNTMHIACSSLEMAQEYAKLTAPATRLLGEFTPGPVTVVVNQTDRLPDDLVTREGTVGIRIPDHPATLQIVAAVGAPVTATSLNQAGEEALPIDRHALGLLDWPALQTVYVVEDNSAISYSAASTLVRVVGPELEILRAGPISGDVLRSVARA